MIIRMIDCFHFWAFCCCRKGDFSRPGIFEGSDADVVECSGVVVDADDAADGGGTPVADGG